MDKKEIILAKIKNKKKLSIKEEMYYLTKILGISEEKAKRMIEIVENKDKNVIIE